MEKDLYIFRHGQTDKNLAHIWQGSGSDDLLNENGIKQAEELGQRMRKVYLGAIYSSPLLRAVQTALKISQNSVFYPNVTILDKLREGFFGDAEGLTYDQVREKFGNLIDDICNPTFENWDLRYPNGESKHEIFDRVYQALRSIMFTNVAPVGIVCHAGVISALRCGLSLGELPEIGNCAVLHLRYNSDTQHFRLIKD